MKNWTIGKRIIFGFASILIITIALGSFAFIKLRSIAAYSENVETNAIPTLLNVEKAVTLATQNRLLVFKHIGAIDKGDVHKLEDQIAQNSQHISECLDGYAATATSREDRVVEEKIAVSRKAYREKMSQVLDMSRSSTNAEQNAATYAFARAELDPVGIAYGAALSAAVDWEKQQSSNDAKGINAAVSSAKMGILIGLSSATLLGIGISFIIIVGVSRALNLVAATLGEGSHQVAAAAAELSGASQSLASGSSEQAASLEETSASLEEVASMTKRNAQNAIGAKDFTSRTRKTTETSAASTREMGQAMEGIRKASGEMRDAMNGIKSASGDVSKIIKTIDEIAFQTNILALNAAVEAARAGEAGMGFAVVADEVRNLAQRSAKAAKETADMIETSIKRSEDGVRVTDKVAGAVEEVAAKSRQLEEHLGEILTNIQQVDAQVGQIAAASQEQSQGIGQVSTAVSQMDKVTQGTAANAEETASAAEELNAQSEVLKDAVNQLQKLVSGRSVAPQQQASAPGTPVKRVAKVATRPVKKISTNGNGKPVIPMEPVEVGVSALPLPDDRDFKDF